MKNTITKRPASIRYLLLFCIVSVVSIAFWYNTQRQLALVMHNSYIQHGDNYINTVMEKEYTKILRQFSSTLGIKSTIAFIGEKPVQYDEQSLVFVINVLEKKGHIEYPPLVRKILSKKEQNTLNETLTQVLEKEDWQKSLQNFLSDVYSFIESVYTS